MNSAIHNRITELGGTLLAPDAATLQQRLESIDLPHPLYPRPVDTPWATAEQSEPIIGLGEYVESHRGLLTSDPTQFYRQLVAHYYAPTEDLRGQVDWRCQLFTPLREGSADYQEWGNGEDFDLATIEANTGFERPDFLFIGFSEGYPNYYFVCTNDPDLDNPRVFSTDHTVYLDEVEACGNLADWLQRFMNADELTERVKGALLREAAGQNAIDGGDSRP